MAGIKGRSGRKSWDKERDSKKLWDRAVPIVLGYLSNQRVSEAARVRVALEIVKKMMPAKLQHSSGLTLEELVAGSASDENAIGAVGNGLRYSGTQ